MYSVATHLDSLEEVGEFESGQWVTSLFRLVFSGDHRWVQIQTETKDQWKVKSFFRSDSAIAESKVNPNLPHYALFVLPLHFFA